MTHYFRLDGAQFPFSDRASPRMALRTPLIIVNLKTYPQGFGDAGLALCRDMAAVADASGACLAAATSALDLRRYATEAGLPVLAQHVDTAPAGAHTGTVLPEAAAAAGAVGTLVNHAEWQLDWSTIKATLGRAHGAGLATVLCTADVEATARGAALRPDYIAVEPPELIGGDISVSTARPEVISDSVAAVAGSGVPLLCGAGVKTQADVVKAMELGAAGILLASGVVKASEPRAVLDELVQGL